MRRRPRYPAVPKIDPKHRLAKTVLSTVESVLQRPRFGIRVAKTPTGETIVSKDDFFYTLQVIPDRDELKLVAMTVDERPTVFFQEGFPTRKPGPIRKIGLKLARKVHDRVVHWVMTA